jgi:serine/threonine protein kinase
MFDRISSDGPFRGTLLDFMENNGSGSLSVQDSAAFDGLIGKTVANNFRLLKRIGAGAMGRVYQAEQLSLGKMVAIKIVRHELMADEKVLRRFELEARTASAVSHPNLVETFDCGRDRTLDVAYIAMELLQGLDLSQVIARESPISLQRSARIMDQVLAALEEAHLQGVVHRDLKPGNIMLVPRRDEADFVKVCDFGIAKVKSGRARPNLTMAGFVFGTPEYMSPEQACGSEVDARTDLYAVAAILYYLVSGELPFPAPSPTEVLARILRDEPERPSSRGYVVVPTAIEDLIMRGLEKNPDKRPQSATEFRVLMRDAWANVIDYWPGQSPGSPTVSLRAPTPAPGTAMPRVASAASPMTPASKTADPVLAPAPVPSSPSAALINWSALRGRQPTWAGTFGFLLTLAAGGAGLWLLFGEHSTDPLAPPARPSRLSDLAPAPRAAMIVVQTPPSPPSAKLGDRIDDRVADRVADRVDSTARAPATPARRESPSRAAQRITSRGKAHHAPEARGAASLGASGTSQRAVAARGDRSNVSPIARRSDESNLANGQGAGSTAQAPPLAAVLAATSYTLRITSVPSEAEVWLDGRSLGHTPLLGADIDMVGSHRLVIRKPGYMAYEQAITTTSGWSIKPSDGSAALLRVSALLRPGDPTVAQRPGSGQ